MTLLSLLNGALAGFLALIPILACLGLGLPEVRR